MRSQSNVIRKLLAVLALMALVAAACGDDADDTATDAGNGDGGGGGATTGDRGNVDGVLKIGYLLPSTGDLSFLGPPMIKGVELAVSQLNEAGGFDGKNIVLVGADDGTDEDVASASVDRLLEEEKVDAIIGAAGTSITLAVIDKISGANVVECSPSNTGANLTDYDDNGYYFRTAPPDNLQGPALAEVIVGDGHEDVAIIGLNNDYGKGLAGFIKEGLEEGGATVSEEVFYDPKGTSFDADVQKIAAANPQAVVIVGYPDTGGQVLQSMIKEGIGPDNVPVYVTDGMQSDKLYEKVDPGNPAVTEGIKGTAPSAAPEGGAANFPDDFSKFAPGTDTIFSAHAYDCAVVIALAAAAAGTDDPSKFVDEMNAVTKDGEACSTIDDCLEAAAAGDDIDYDGAAGPLDFAEKGEPAAGAYDVYEFGADGNYEVLRQVAVKPES